MPRVLRMLRYSSGAAINRKWDYAKKVDEEPPYFGAPAVDVTVPVASRIPDALLERIRQYKGSLKLRFTRETLLVGWQVQNGKSYPWRRDNNGRAYATDEDVMIGGDFCEQQRVYCMIDGTVRQEWRKGSQIDPRTGHKVETDF